MIFDCSAEFDGQSLNKELLTGIDLTNQNVVVPTRFWQNSIAFMTAIGDILLGDGSQTSPDLHKFYVVE